MTDQKIALVTGANRGIGRETVLQLARDHQMKVFLGARDLAKGQAAARAIGHDVEALELDVSNEASVESAFAEITQTQGRLDVLINNAGLDYDTDQRAVSADMARVRRAFDTNFFGAWMTAQAAIALLRKSSSPRIVNVSSGAGAIADMGGGTPGYSISKTAMNALTIKLAAELARDRFLVNAVCPGWVATDMGGGGRPVPEGAKGLVWAATLPDNGPTGGFFRDGSRIAW